MRPSYPNLRGGVKAAEFTLSVRRVRQQVFAQRAEGVHMLWGRAALS